MEVKPLIKSYLQRLDSLLVQEKEAFTGLEDQIGNVVNKLGKIGKSFDDGGNREEDAATVTYVNEVRDVINDIENHIEKFLSNTGEQLHHGVDQTTVIDCFRNSMQKIDVRLAETIKRKTQLSFSTNVEDDMEVNKSSNEMKESQTSASSSSSSSKFSSIESDITKLPEWLRICLVYCCIIPGNHLIHKGKLIRLLVAEGLIEEKEGTLMEDIAEEYVCELIRKGMLQINEEHSGNGTKLQVPSFYREFCLGQMKEGKFRLSSSVVPQKARCVVSNLDMFKIDNLQLWSLFLIGNQRSFEEKSDWLKSKSLRVLDLEGTKIKSLPQQVGDLIHLTYLCLKDTEISELPQCLINLKDLQTLDIRWCGNIAALPSYVTSLLSLRHLKMFKNSGVCGVKIPQGIGNLRNLLTLTGIGPNREIARELGDLTQLRRLGVMDVTEENTNELSSSIMKMHTLLSLSLESKFTSMDREKLVLVDSFSPPLSLRKLRLEGGLEKIPSWLGSLEGLTNVRLGYSHLLEDPALVLQLLPNLKSLTLWHAYDGSKMGKEFCRAGGFPKLKSLTISSYVLEEWTELEEGAMPSLDYLHFHSCMKLRTLPEGLQFVTTLNRLALIPLLDDHEERLKPDGGLENYKIKHIPRISFITTSMVEEIFTERERR